MKGLTQYFAFPKKKLSEKHETGEWIADRLHAMTFSGRFSCGCRQTEQTGRSVPFRGKKDKRPDLMEDCNGKCPSPSFVLKRTVPESGDRIFQAPTGNIPTCFPFFHPVEIHAGIPSILWIHFSSPAALFFRTGQPTALPAEQRRDCLTPVWPDRRGFA